MIIESGVIIFLGLLFIFVKLPRRWALRLLGQPLALDLVVSTAAYILHWGTFSGVMAAAVAGLMCSGFTAVGRWAIGYSNGGQIVPGVFTRRAS
jgi:hypothetical protein